MAKDFKKMSNREFANQYLKQIVINWAKMAGKGQVNWLHFGNFQLLRL